MLLTRTACLLIALAVPAALPAQSFRGAWSGTNSYAVGDSVTYLGNTYVNIAATAPTTSSSSSLNLFNPTTINQNSAVNSDNGSLAAFGGSDFESTDYIPVPAGGSFVTNITINYFGGTPNFGIAFYDAGHAYVGGLSNPSGGFLALASATPIAVPSSASYARFWYQRSGEGPGITDANAIVNAGSTLQSGYSPYGTGGSATTVLSAAPTDSTHWALLSGSTTLPFAGKKMFCLGDSILYLSGAGVACGNIATKIGATLSSQGDTSPGVDALVGRSFDTFQNGQNRPISAAVLADVDVIVIMLGTNQDSTIGLGSPADTPSLGASSSMSSQMKYMIETILQWKRGIRIVVVGPYQSNRYKHPIRIGRSARQSGQRPDSRERRQSLCPEEHRPGYEGGL